VGDDIPGRGSGSPEDEQGTEPAVWTRRTTIDEPRLSELVALYEELGFEVALRPVSREELGDACSECMLATPERFKTIYTRPRRKEDGTPGDGSWAE
jgi:hypothetical protein